MPVKVLRAGNYYDIFLGDGWYNHTRVHVIKNKGTQFIKHISGTQLNPAQVREILGIKD